MVAHGCQKTKQLICGMEGEIVVVHGHLPSPAPSATGSTIALVGAVRNLRQKIGKVEFIHPVSWILRDLTSSMNIGYMFLRTHRISVMFDGEEPVLHHQ